MFNRLINLIFRNKQLKNLSIYGFGQLFNLVTPILIVPLIINVCGEENYGKSAVGMAICFFLIVFIDFGVEITGVKSISVYRNSIYDLQKIFNLTFTVRLLLFTITTILFYIVVNSFEFFYSERKMFLLGISVLLGHSLSPIWLLQGIENVRWISYTNIISKMLYLIGVFFTVKNKQDYLFINLCWGIGMIVSNSIFLFLSLKKYGLKFNFISINEVILSLRKDFKIFLVQILSSLQMYAPIVFLSYFTNNTIAGQYRIIEQIIVIFRTYIILFFNYVYPRVCFLFSSNFKRGFVVWRTYNGINFIMLHILMSLIYVNANEIICYFTKNQIDNISDLLRIALLIPFLLTISTPLKQLVLALNYEIEYVKITSAMLLFNIIGMLIVIPSFGIKGVLYSLIITDFIIIFFYLKTVRSIILNSFRFD